MEWAQEEIRLENLVSALVLISLGFVSAMMLGVGRKRDHIAMCERESCLVVRLREAPTIRHQA